jgi:hypothetical protein
VTEFVVVALEGMVGNVFSAPLIALFLLRRTFRLAVASVLVDARQLRSIHREHGRSGALPHVASEMANRLAAQLETATKELRGNLGLAAYVLGKRRELARTCATASWGIMLSRGGQAEKAEILVEFMELLDTALSSWRVGASSQALKRFPATVSKWLPDEGGQPS